MFLLVSHWVHNNTQTNRTFGSFHSVPVGQNEKKYILLTELIKKFPRKTYLEKMQLTHKYKLIGPIRNKKAKEK